MLMPSTIPLAGALAASTVAELPAGWRAPTAAELADPMFVDAPDAFTRVVADLDGDAVEDLALVLRSTSERAEALWVRRSGGGKPEWILLHRQRWGAEHPEVGLAMRIDEARPGRYRSHDTGREHRFVISGIECFRPGSASSAFFWMPAEGRFQQVWISD